MLYYGSPYHQNSAFYPAIEQLKRGLRFESNDNPAQKFAKLEAVLDEFGLPVSDFAPVLASLLSLPTSPSYPHLDLSPEQLKTKTLKALVSIVEAMALRDPVLMVVEDLHWIDPSTLELISLLVEQLRATRIFLVVTFRPPFERPWSAHAHVTALTLNRLSRKDSAAIIAKMTRGKSLPAEVLEQIVAKTDGMPLFVEELTKTVLESGLLEEAGRRYVLSGPLPPLAIPASLRDSLMARLDRLASVKEVAQLAATLGRTFAHRLLAAVSLLEARKLDDALSQLVEAELIYRRGLPPDVTYEFKHVLVQDAAYQSLLKASRQQYHQRIARVLEEQFAETAETEPELLAHHYTEAHLHDQAIDYWQKAGERASERSASLEAIAHLAKGLELIKKLPESEGRAKQELGLHLTLGPALMSIKGWGAPEVDRAYLRAQELCRQVGEPCQLFVVTWGLWHHNQHSGNLKMARRLAAEVLSLSKQQSDAGLLLQAHHAAWTTHFSQPELVSCRDHAEEGIALYSFEDHRSHAFLYGGHDPGVCARVHAAAALWLLGFAQQALTKAHDAQRLAEDLAHPHSLAQALSYSTYLYQFRREIGLVRERAEATISLCAEEGIAPHYSAHASILRGWAISTEGHTIEGITEMRRGLADLRAQGAEKDRPYFLALLADVYEQANQIEEGLDTLAQALHLIEQTGEHKWEAELHRLKGELLRSRAKTDQAEACFGEAIAVARRQQAKSFELRAAMSLSRLWRQQGKHSEARGLLAPIYDWFTEGFDTPDLCEAKTLLEELS